MQGYNWILCGGFTSMSLKTQLEKIWNKAN